MIIKSITLENFRQYKNINTIEFSTDPEKNVTVILGVNTSGKTTIIQAFNWCLYETTSFKSKEMLLNSELAAALPPEGYANVRVRIVLVHDNIEYTISRSQRFTCTSIGKVRGDRTVLSVNCKESNGNSFPIASYECSNTINKILPPGLSDYFFFDGERIQDINNKKDVVSAVRGLMGLDVVKVAVDHLDPNKPTSVVRKLRNELNIGSDADSKRYSDELTKLIENLDNAKSRLNSIEQEIEYAKGERVRLADILRGTAEVRELQKSRDRLSQNISGASSGYKSSQVRLFDDFNRDYFGYFILPLIGRVKSVLAGSNKQIEGIPEMNAKAIDYILARKKCICGCDLSRNQGAIDNIEYEKSLLPPQHVGSMVRSFNESCDMIQSQSRNAMFSKTIQSDYLDMRRYNRRIGEMQDELKTVSDQIKQLGSVNVTQLENDNIANERTLEQKIRQKGQIEEQIRSLENAIEDKNKRINSLALQCEKNNLLRREIEYAIAVFEWFKQSYDRQEQEVKRDLLDSVNKIFDKMYHGSRSVTIDDNYRIQLITSIGDERISTDESKGLEAVKNFSFISGLVDLARKKARKVEKPAFSDEPDIFTTEPYPIVMDAPFSNVDEIHINNISSLLPEIAEQVILIVMNKDWNFAKTTMESKVGASYYIEKIDNSDTYSTIRRI